MSLQKNMRFAIGVDVGGSHVCSAVVSLATGEIAGCVSEAPLDSGADAAAILDILSSNILQSLEPVEDGTVEGVGLAFPGPFDYPNGISKVNGVGKYERIYGLNLKTSLSSRLRSHGMDSFRFLNDASAFALGECAGGAGRGADRVVAITLGTGVGSGFVCETVWSKAVMKSRKTAGCIIYLLRTGLLTRPFPPDGSAAVMGSFQEWRLPERRRLPPGVLPGTGMLRTCSRNMVGVLQDSSLLFLPASGLTCLSSEETFRVHGRFSDRSWKKGLRRGAAVLPCGLHFSGTGLP